MEMADNTSLSCSNVIPEDNTDTPEKQVNLYDTFNTDDDTYEIQAHGEESEARDEKNVVPERTVEEAEAEVAEYKLKVETLESEIDKLREELSKKN